MNSTMIKAYKILAYVLKHGRVKASKRFGRINIMIALCEIRKHINIRIAARKLCDNLPFSVKLRAIDAMNGITAKDWDTFGTVILFD